jgi:hypothetical protein
MNDERILEREVAALFADSAPPRGPEDLLDHVFHATSRTRPRPDWLALIKEPPMRLSTGVAVGSPTVRVVTVLLTTLLLAILATGAVVTGAALLNPAIVVAPDGSGTFRTITEAIASADDGDTILVKPGVYRESVTVTEDITLKGDGPRDQVVIEVAATSPTAEGYWYGPSYYGMILDGSDAVVSNLTFRGLTGEISSTGLTVRGGSPVIHDVTTDEGHGAAAYFTGGTTGVIRDSTLGGLVSVNGGSPAVIVNNVMQQHVLIENPVGTAAAVVRGNHLPGVAVATEAEDWSGKGGPAVIEDNVFALPVGTTDVGLSDFLGITLQGADHVVVQRNTMSGFSIGIDYRRGTNATIVDNQLHDNATGIATYGHGLIARNSVRGGSDGIVVWEGSPAIEDNGVEGSSNRGITVLTGGTPTLTGNTLCGNATNLYIAGGAQPVLGDNNVCPDGLAETGT